MNELHENAGSVPEKLSVYLAWALVGIVIAVLVVLSLV